MTPSGPHAFVTLPWAQHIWDTPAAPDVRDTMISAFAPPTLDPDDRGETRPADVVSLAVVLDLLATRLRKVAQGPTLLAQATQDAVGVGLLGGADGDAVCARLLALSQNPTAQARATFVAAFGQSMHAVIDTRAAPERASTQDAVAHAMARVTQATELVIREAELLLAQRRARSSWQI